MPSPLTRRDALRLGLGLGLGTVALTSSVTAPAHADVSGPQAATGSFASRYRGGQETVWEVLYPPGFTPGDRLPVMITLHGKGGNHTTPEGLRFLEHAETLRAEGLRPFACVGVDGGDTWWHDRADGTDSAAMVAYELAPILNGLGLDLTRPALYGLSMGGMGAVWLASRLGPNRLSSLTIASTPFPATWDRFSGSYDSPADFAAHDIRRHWASLRGLPIRVDIGDQDSFLQENLALRPLADPQPEFSVSPGGHDWDYWGRVALDQLRFVSRHLG